jgi:uroporphyrinogen decarboxylase
MNLTGIERITNILKRQPVDRIGLFEHFWSDTQSAWTARKNIPPGVNFADHFGFDMDLAWPLNMVADLDYQPEIVSEDEETRTTRDGNGALLRTHKLHDATPEHIDFMVKDRAGWEQYIKPKLTVDRRRINFQAYRDAKEACRKANRFFAWSGVNVFEIMKDVTGHMYMLIGMAEDPDWVRDMAMTYAKLTVDLQEILFAEEGWPDGIWYYEDMGFKRKPFMSPDMYREILQPAHEYTFRFAKSHQRPVIVHSCGYVAPLIPGLMEAGIDCLQVIEVKAGMDLLKLYHDYGERLSFMGGIDVRTLYTNDRAIIDAELESKVPTVKGHYGYVLHSDHSIPNTVNYETYRYFIQRGLELGKY